MRRSNIGLVAVAAAGGVVLAMAFPVIAACHNAVFVGDPYSVSEGASKVTITVSNQAGQPPGGTVDYRTVDASAKAGQDYIAKSGTLSFGAGESEKSFDVPITNDTGDEPNETFTVELSNPTGCFITGNLDPPATVTIQDNDAPAPQPKPTQTQRPATTPRPSTPTPTVTPTPTPTPTSTSPSPNPTNTAVAVADENDDGIPPGAVAGIVAGVLALGGLGAYFVRRWMRRAA